MKDCCFQASETASVRLGRAFNLEDAEEVVFGIGFLAETKRLRWGFAPDWEYDIVSERAAMGN